MWRWGIVLVSTALVLGACDPSPKPPASTATASVSSSPKPSATPPPTSSASVPAPALSWEADEPLEVLTYNVLATPLFEKTRTTALLDVLQKSNAHIIALQEVEAWFLKALVAAPWVAKRYHLSSQGGQPIAPGGQIILSRFPIDDLDVVSLPGRQRRTLMMAHITVGGRHMAVATTHMESFLDDGPVRARQLDGVFSLLRRAPDAILLGDFNFGDGEQPETKHLDPAYVDLWTKLRPGEPGFTWNMADNPLARIGAFVGEGDRRLDRILVRSAVWRGKSVSIVGDHSTGKQTLTPEQRTMIEMPDRRGTPKTEDIEVFPSDHYGLQAELVPAKTAP